MKEEYIEQDILCYFLEKGLKAFWKNDIKGFYNQKKGYYQKNKSNFIKTGISDISLLYKGKFIVIEVKKPSEMTFFDKPLAELQTNLATKYYTLKADSLKKYAHAVEQRKFIDEVISEGGVGFFACSLEQVKERLKENDIVL